MNERVLGGVCPCSVCEGECIHPYMYVIHTLANHFISCHSFIASAITSSASKYGVGYVTCQMKVAQKCLVYESGHLRVSDLLCVLTPTPPILTMSR